MLKAGKMQQPIRRMWERPQVELAFQTIIQEGMTDLYYLLEGAIVTADDSLCQHVIETACRTRNIHLCHAILKLKDTWRADLLWKALKHCVQLRLFDTGQLILKSANDWQEKHFSIYGPDGEEPNDFHEAEEGAICEALRSDNEEFFSMLMNCVPDWSYYSMSKLLATAIDTDKLDICNLILNEYFVNKKDISPYLYGPLDIAASKGNLDMYYKILSMVHVYEPWRQGQSMAFAIRHGHTDFVQCQLSAHKDWCCHALVDAIKECVKSKYCCLFDILLGKIDGIHAFIFSAQDIGSPPLSAEVIQSGNEDICRKVLAKVNNWTDETISVVMCHVAKYANEHICQFFLDNMPDLSTETVKDAIYSTAERGRNRICSRLINAVSCKWPASALHRALETATDNLNESLTETLLTSANDWTEWELKHSLKECSLYNHSKLVELLLDACSSWRAKDLKDALANMTKHQNISLVVKILSLGRPWSSAHLIPAAKKAGLVAKSELYKDIIGGADDWSSETLSSVFDRGFLQSPPNEINKMCRYILSVNSSAWHSTTMSIPLWYLCNDGFEDTCIVILDSCTDWDEKSLILPLRKALGMKSGAVIVHMLKHHHTIPLCKYVLNYIAHHRVYPNLYIDVTKAIASYLKDDKYCQDILSLANVLHNCLSGQYFEYSLETDGIETLSYDGDITLCDIHGRKPILLAAWFKLPSLLRDLLQKGADIMVTDRNKQSVMHYAVSVPLHPKYDPINANKEYSNMKFQETIDTLVSSGASVNHQDRFGNTPLHIAIFEGNALACECLRKYDPDTHIPNLKGISAYEYALELNMIDVMRVLYESKDQNVNDTDSKLHMSACHSILLKHRPCVIQYHGETTPLPQSADLVKTLAQNSHVGNLEHSKKNHHCLIFYQCHQLVKCLRKRLAEKYPIFQGGFEISGSIREGTKTAPMNELDVLIHLPMVEKYIEHFNCGYLQSLIVRFDEEKFVKEHPYITEKLPKIWDFEQNLKDQRFTMCGRQHRVPATGSDIWKKLFDLLQNTLLGILVDPAFWVQCKVPSLQWIQHLKHETDDDRVAEPLLLRWLGPEGIVWLSMDLVPVISSSKGSFESFPNRLQQCYRTNQLMAVLRPYAYWRITHYHIERAIMRSLTIEQRLAYVVAKILVKLCSNGKKDEIEIFANMQFTELHRNISSRLNHKLKEEKHVTENIPSKNVSSIEEFLSSYALKNALFHWLDPYTPTHLMEYISRKEYIEAVKHHPYRLVHDLPRQETLCETYPALLPYKELMDSDDVYEEEILRSRISVQPEGIESKYLQTDNTDWSIVHETVRGIFQTVDIFLQAGTVLPCYLYPSDHIVLQARGKQKVDVSSVLDILSPSEETIHTK